MRPLILALCLSILAAPALADWRYCLARGPHRTVYVSAPFSSLETLDRLGTAFAQELDRERHAHDPVQCPRAEEAASLRAMRHSALRFNREEGETIVELDWLPERDARTAGTRP
ncbi:hypothetical protein [Methylobacterium sp. ID0610]|uniref:hypothetical protein n=1 Tax=Methylobacterium carpenticola TaxID=3344827 RepID=UPI0036C52893